MAAFSARLLLVLCAVGARGYTIPTNDRSASAKGFSQYLHKCRHGYIWEAGSVSGSGHCQPDDTPEYSCDGDPQCPAPEGGGGDITPNTTSASACEEGWSRLKSSCYLLYSEERKDWDEGIEFCQSLNASLAKITSEDEHALIHNLVEDNVWIGLTDRKSDGEFVWTDGTKPEYTRWDVYEPSGGSGQHCTSMKKDANYAWNDDFCEIKYGVVCEKQVDADA